MDEGFSEPFRLFDKDGNSYIMLTGSEAYGFFAKDNGKHKVPSISKGGVFYEFMERTMKIFYGDSAMNPNELRAFVQSPDDVIALKKIFAENISNDDDWLCRLMNALYKARDDFSIIQELDENDMFECDNRSCCEKCRCDAASVLLFFLMFYVFKDKLN